MWKSTTDRSWENNVASMAWGARNLIPHRYGRRYAKNQIALNLLRHINELNKRHDTEEVDVETFAAFVKSHPASVAARVLDAADVTRADSRRRVVGPAVRARESEWHEPAEYTI